MKIFTTFVFLFVEFLVYSQQTITEDMLWTYGSSEVVPALHYPSASLSSIIDQSLNSDLIVFGDQGFQIDVDMNNSGEFLFTPFVNSNNPTQLESMVVVEYPWYADNIGEHIESIFDFREDSVLKVEYTNFSGFDNSTWTSHFIFDPGIPLLRVPMNQGDSFSVEYQSAFFFNENPLGVDTTWSQGIFMEVTYMRSGLVMETPFGVYDNVFVFKITTPYMGTNLDNYYYYSHHNFFVPLAFTQIEYNTVTFNLFLDYVTSVNDGKEVREEILVYPNPAENQVFIQVKKTSVIDIYSIDGTLVVSEVLYPGRTQVSLEALTSGMYFLKTGRTCVKFLKL